MENNASIEVWKKAWNPEIHTTEYALKRIKSAQAAKLTPIKIDNDELYGDFQGSSGRYKTLLDYCPCGDFHRSKLPCKHIYRLAIELGLIDIKADTNKSVIPTPKQERAHLDATIDIIEKLSVDAQHSLLTIAANIRSTSPIYPVVLNSNIDELISAGVIVDSNPPKYEIAFGKKAEIMELLDNENILYDKKAKKGTLEEICTKHIPEKAREKFGVIRYVTIPTIFSPQKIHHYLHRKYDYELCYGEDMNNFCKIPLLETDLPDDDVTNQLIKRGYYVRK